jgi:hypothetical protein
VLVPNGDKHLGQSKSTTLRGVMVEGWPRPKASEDAGTNLYRSRSRRHEGLDAASRRDEESASPPRYPPGRKAHPGTLIRNSGPTRKLGGFHLHSGFIGPLGSRPPRAGNGSGTGVLFFGWGCFEAMRSIGNKPGGSLQWFA